MKRALFNPPTTSPRELSRRSALGLGATVAAGVLVSPRLLAAEEKRLVVVWSEGTANVDPKSGKVYPQDINTAIAEGLQPLATQGWEVVKASLNDLTTWRCVWWGRECYGWAGRLVSASCLRAS